MRIVSAKYLIVHEPDQTIIATDDRGREWSILDTDAAGEVPAALRDFIAAGGTIMSAS